MKYALPLVLVLVASPALAHAGDGLQFTPNVGAAWLLAFALLGVAAMGARMAPARLRSRK
ncbi:hypothetical protein [Salipiger bermudensis]|uniref:hypothetical protein n=1 Tax=Salipiger bermudensis TaxID=344736 RepID=UPI001CD7D7D9|nr:hypothetical protein [Salipiger bermudensis]MCA0961549.1 hypothetical protein [Salipiger bermudensis]